MVDAKTGVKSIEEIKDAAGDRSSLGRLRQLCNIFYKSRLTPCRLAGEARTTKKFGCSLKCRFSSGRFK
jgi:hypothetical protein